MAHENNANKTLKDWVFEQVQHGVTWYDTSMLPLIITLVGPHDSISWITPYSCLHAFSGWFIAFLCNLFNLGPDLSIAIVVALGAGWEIFEYWVSPVLGYWAVRNTANVAIDIVTVLVLFMLTYDSKPAWSFNMSVTASLFVAGFLVGRAATAKVYNPEKTAEFSKLEKRWLLKLSAKRKHFPKHNNKETVQTQVALCRRRVARFYNRECCGVFLNNNDYSAWLTTVDGLQERPLLSPAHRMLAALCATVIAVHLEFNWNGTLMSLIAALVGFAVSLPSDRTLLQEDLPNKEQQPMTDKSMYLCPFYRVWPQNSLNADRWRGRNRARRKFRARCLPVRFLLIILLLLAGPHTSWQVLLSLAIASFVFVLYNLCKESKTNRVWWSREYLLIEIAAIIVFFAVLDLTLACHVTCAVLAVHWFVSVWISGVWPPVTEEHAISIELNTRLPTPEGPHSSNAANRDNFPLLKF